MAFKADYKTTFEPSHVIAPIYTGGPVALSEDGKILATCLGEDVLISNLHTGKRLVRIDGDGDGVTTVALAPDASYVVLCSRTLSMRIFALETSQADEERLQARLVRSLKPHAGPVIVSAVDSTGTLLATGGADGMVKVWDVRRGFTTHTLHGHSGIVSALHFFQVDMDALKEHSPSRKRKSRSDDVPMTNGIDESTAGFRLASAGEDGKIRIWNLQKRKSIAVLDSHVSVVKSLDYSSEKRLLLSASRDGTAILWDAASWQAATTVPVLEPVERAAFIHDGEAFFTGGETARLRIWNLKGQEVTADQQAGLETEAIVDVLAFPGLAFVLSVHADQTLLLLSLDFDPTSQSIQPLTELRRISGTHDEIIDLAFIGVESSLMALATNSEDIRLINVGQGHARDETSEAPLPFGSDVALLRGHDDIIITIATDWSGHWLATGAKDNTAKLWKLDPANSTFECWTTLSGHAESISAVALPKAVPAAGSAARVRPLDHPPEFLITGSQDKTIKKWDFTGSKSSSKAAKSAYTRKAHDKEMNAIDVSFSSSLFASASQDRTVKIWDVQSGESVGVLRGHKRGVWTVAFSPPSIPAISGESGTSSGNRGMVVTGSGDKTVRIWSLNDFSCLRTFEGHTNSVLKVVWLPFDTNTTDRRKRGPYVASAAGDGLVKIWDAAEDECSATLDNHIDRVWALAVRPSDRNPSPRAVSNPKLELVSGSADSTLTFWTDTTTQTAQTATRRATARVEQDQQLRNAMHAHNYRDAIVLALTLNHPRRLLELFTSVLDAPDRDRASLTGRAEVDAVLRALDDEQLWRLLLRLRDWNSNARTARVAQAVLHAVLRSYPRERLVKLRRRRGKRRPDGDRDGLELEVEGLRIGDDEDDDDQRKKRGGRTENVRDVLDGLKAYTDKHYARLERMSEEQYVLLWTLQQMDERAPATNGGVE